MNYQSPIRTFEEQGVVDPAQSYYVPLEGVMTTRNQNLRTIVDRGRYCTIFAPRQSGKTTFFEQLCDELERDPAYIAIRLSFQDYKTIEPTRFYALVQKALYTQLRRRLKDTECDELPVVQAFLNEHIVSDHLAFRMLFEELCELLPRHRIVIFIDEFDGIPRAALENFLASVRELYQAYKKRPHKALHSLGLVGIRNITKLIVGGVSPFNIADEVKLPPFTLDNIRDLYAQYTTETNQYFTEDAILRVYAETDGQPWLVNRLGTILTTRIKPASVESITVENVDTAIQYLLQERNSHFDNLIEKAKLYRETFVSIVFNGVEYNPDDDNQSWLEQYGLIKPFYDKATSANSIYQRRFLRVFFKDVYAAADVSQQRYYAPDGSLNMEAILLDFDEYIARIGVNAFYERQKPYEKTGQFLLTAWLYQFVQGGQGELRYESSTGLGRMDILLTYQGRKYIIETKLNRGKLLTTIESAVSQVVNRYLLPERVQEGYVVVFDVKTLAGEMCESKQHHVKGTAVTSFVTGIGRPCGAAPASLPALLKVEGR